MSVVRYFESEIDQSELKLSCHTAKIAREGIKFMRHKKSQWSAKISRASLHEAIPQVLESQEAKTRAHSECNLFWMVFDWFGLSYDQELGPGPGVLGFP